MNFLVPDCYRKAFSRGHFFLGYTDRCLTCALYYEHYIAHYLGVSRFCLALCDMIFRYLEMVSHFKNLPSHVLVAP